MSTRCGRRSAPTWRFRLLSVAMELIRHSEIGLTMKVYTDPRLLPLAAAIEATGQ